MSESPFLYLSVEQIRELHAAVLEEHGGTRGSRMGGSLDSCVTAPQKGGVFARGGCFPASLCLRLFDFRKESFQGWKLPDSARDGARFFGDQRRGGS
jgi:hypothetical protein